MGGPRDIAEAARGFEYPFNPYFGIGFWEVFGGRSIDDAGELPGVPANVPLERDRSADTILEIDSRRLEFDLAVTGSVNIARCSILSSRSRMRAESSLLSLKISPLTVSLSFSPFCMIVSTRCIAGK